MADGDRRVTREVILGALLGPLPTFDAEPVLARLLESAEVLDVRPGDVLIRADEPTEHVFVMADGRVRLSRPGLADIVYRGRWMIGSNDAVLRRPRRRTVTVEAGSQILRASARVYLELVEERIDLTALTLLGLARGIVDLLERIGDGSWNEPATRPGLAPTSLVERLALLEAVPLLSGATLQAIADLASAATVEELEPGDVLVDPRRPDPRLFVVADGVVELVRGARRGAYGPGELVGGAAWHVARDGGFEATARGRATVLAIAVDDWIDRMEEHPSLAVTAVAALSAERERLQDELAVRLGELVLD